MKKYFVILVAALMASATANAQRRQQMSADEMLKMRTEMVQRQTERMAKDLDLKGDAKTAFMETYAKYQTELNEAMGDMSSMFGGRADDVKAEKLSDEECYAKIKENLDMQEKQVVQSQKRLEITKKYMAEFMSTLTPQQLYKVFGQRQRMGGGGNQRGGGQRGGGGFGGGFPGGGMPPMGGGGFGGGFGGGGF